MRDASAADIPHIVDLGERMAARAGLQGHVGYDRESVAQTLAQLIESPDGILICSDTGMIGGICHPHPFNLGVKAGQELFWYSEGEDGLQLLEACEAKAKALGCQFWTMICEETLRPKAVGRLYERRGYRLLEHSYIREL